MNEKQNPAGDSPEASSALAYTTSTGDTPVSHLAKVTTKATDPALRPAKKIAKKVTKKRTPRTRAKTEPLHTDIRVDKAVMKAARNIVEQGIYTKLEIVDHETVIVR